MTEPTQEQIKEFLARINDNTGTVRRYAKSLERNQALWEVKENGRRS